ncbi:hypothetical protein Cni_G00257 [Canna indica]|uniref:Uncharacterized protein n=1 Tax=Canna indica TaxID=4628 RepID=A0AAQ3JKM5_9LILI|nr:hypothetical protein Cni_G00257 [Canna indica]
MAWSKVVIAFLALQSIVTLLSMHSAAGDLLSPILQPIFDNVCNHSVECGKGSCQETSDSLFGFVCNCDKGWTQFHVGDNFRFLPCIIPKCDINYSCSNDTTTRATAPLPNHPNFSLSDPCLLSYCGGGTCVKTSTFGHRCDCQEGFSNLLNQTSLPCYRDCSLGADCANLGISLPNSPPSPPSLPDSGGSSSSGGCRFSANSLRWILLTLAMAVVGAAP